MEEYIKTIERLQEEVRRLKIETEIYRDFIGEYKLADEFKRFLKANVQEDCK